MADLAAFPDDPDAVARAVRALMPAFRRQARLALAVMALSAALAATAILVALGSGLETRALLKVVMVGVIGLGLVVVAARRWAVRRQEAAVMSIFARSIGLTHAKDASAFVRSLPKRLLPERSLRKGEDHIHGTLGAHAIEMAEVTAETGGKSSRILFRGIVARFPNRTAMPAFFIALADDTRSGLFSGANLSTEGLHHRRDVAVGQRSYGIWTSSKDGPEPPALSAVIGILTGLETVVPGAQLYAATSNGEVIHVALTHGRNLFRIGGLFPGEDRIFADVQAALRDLAAPLSLANALIQAEAAAAQKLRGRESPPATP